MGVYDVDKLKRELDGVDIERWRAHWRVRLEKNPDEWSPVTKRIPTEAEIEEMMHSDRLYHTLDNLGR